MAQQTINIGTTANDGTGDPLRTAFDKVNDNFTELYTDDAGDVNSVNGATGVVVLDSDDITEGSTNLYNATHTGDVTGSVALTIASNAVTNAKINNGAVNMDKLSTTVVVTESEGIASNDNDTTLPTSAAVKDFVDTATASFVDTNTEYTAGSGLDLTNEQFSVESDLRDGITHIGVDTGDYIEFTADTQMDFYVNSLNQMRLEADGDLHVEGDVIAASTTVSSDKNLKKDISTYEDALQTISKLNGVSFTWKSNDKKSGGVIAQDVQKVLPELVGTKKSLEGGEETLTVDYNGLIGVLIQAVKQLSKQVDELEKR
jgi:hypothetical protein